MIQRYTSRRHSISIGRDDDDDDDGGDDDDDDDGDCSDINRSGTTCRWACINEAWLIAYIFLSNSCPSLAGFQH